MIKRRAVVFCFAVLVSGVVNIPVASGQTGPDDDASQEQAAEEVQDQLEATDEPIAMTAINALDELGPAPWLSLGRARSEKVVEAWVEVAKQLPSEDLLSSRERRRRPRPLTFTESEDPDQTGGNDRPESGDRIKGFGTGRREDRVVAINGHLSGAEVRPPIDFDCPSVEDDGAIPLANPAGPNVAFGALCGGEIGDGPHGQTTGDVDFFSFGEVEPGTILILDLAHISGSLQPVEGILGIYDASGTLVASGEDTGDPNQPVFVLHEALEGGVFYGAVAGCCELPSDPFDPTSGPGVADTGTYEVFVVAVPPPCMSSEDDGSIPRSNATNVDQFEIDFCPGVIGDGPHGQTSGDADFYALGTVEAGFLLLADVVNFENSPDQVNTVVGIYDAAGTLLASAEDSGDPDAPEFLEVVAPETGDYYVAVAGCCELTADPFDSGSGLGVTETGTYDVVVGGLQPPPPPCLSVEDDGAIPLANDASQGFGDDQLFFTNCQGEVGDGPQVATGDVDFFTTREMVEGKVLVVDFIDFIDGPAGASSNFTIGVYDSAGNLLASGQDSPDPADRNFFEFTVPATAVYHVVIAGGLPTDPFDPATGTDTAIGGLYDVFFVDITRELLDEIIGGPQGAGWQRNQVAADAVAGAAGARAAQREAVISMLEDRRAAAQSEVLAEPVVDVDYFLVRLRKGDAISGGFDDARIAGIVDPDGVVRMESQFNVSFIYPAESPLRHDRRTGFDHVATKTGLHAVFVTEGVAAYEGELRVTRSGLADERSRALQTIFLDFDGAEVSPSDFGPPIGDPVPPQALSPLASFLPAWGLDPGDEDAVIDAVVDAVIENLDTDLRIRDGRNGNRDASRKGTEFDVEVLNSRDHGDAWGGPNVSRIVVGGTINELQIPTIGIAQSIDPGNTDTEETGVVLLDLLSGPAGDPVSLNSYPVAGGATVADLVGFAVGHIAAHEVGHFIGSWHTETFNPQVSLMDAGGEFESIFGVGPDGVFGTSDDVDADFAEDIFNFFEGFVGVEDTAGRSVFGLSTGQKRPPPTPAAVIGDSVTTVDGAGVGGVEIDLYSATRSGRQRKLIRSTTTNYAGHYQFELTRGCYLVVFNAPPGTIFVGGGSEDRQHVCMDRGQTDLSIDAVLVRLAA